MQEPRTTCQVFVNPLDWVFNVGSTIDFLRTCEPLDAVCKESFVLLFFFFSVCVPVHFSGKDHQLWSYSQRSPWLEKVYAHCLVLLAWLLRPSVRPCISWQLPVPVLLTVTWMDLPGGLLGYTFSLLPLPLNSILWLLPGLACISSSSSKLFLFFKTEFISFPQKPLICFSPSWFSSLVDWGPETWSLPARITVEIRTPVSQFSEPCALHGTTWPAKQGKVLSKKRFLSQKITPRVLNL